MFFLRQTECVNRDVQDKWSFCSFWLRLLGNWRSMLFFSLNIRTVQVNRILVNLVNYLQVCLEPVWLSMSPFQIGCVSSENVFMKVGFRSDPPPGPKRWTRKDLNPLVTTSMMNDNLSSSSISSTYCSSPVSVIKDRREISHAFEQCSCKLT